MSCTVNNKWFGVGVHINRICQTHENNQFTILKYFITNPYSTNETCWLVKMTSTAAKSNVKEFAESDSTKNGFCIRKHLYSNDVRMQY